jgi:branched-chain amino acid aminotransferase
VGAGPGTPPLAWIDGALVPRDEARVSIDDMSVRYGLACFETMLARHGRVFRLAEHLDRMEAGMRLFRAEPPPRTELARAVDETLRANGLAEASVRLSVSPGRGTRPALPATGTPGVTVTIDPLAAPPSAPRLWVSEVRIDASRPWRGVKLAHFAPYLLARAEARERGYDDALLLEHAGHLVEAATANLFLVSGDALLTPPLADGPLPGVTRAAVIEVARSLRVDVRETSLTLSDIGRSNSAFLTSSVAGLIGVASITWDARGREEEWAPGSDEVTLVVALRDAYERLVTSETGRRQ